MPVALAVAAALAGLPAPADAPPAAAGPAAAYVQLEPVPGGAVSFRVRGVEATRWHPGGAGGRPFFYPLTAPTAAPGAGSLVRMGHPGAPNHDHHRGVWFAHRDVDGRNFWENDPNVAVRQTEWLALESGLGEGRMACRIAWVDADGRTVLTQELVTALRPLGSALNEGGYELELTVAFRPGEDGPGEDGPDVGGPITLGETNFGLLGVRVAESVSAHFGAGQLTDDAGRTGEAAIFGNPARWVDYSGPVPVGRGDGFRFEPHGVTVFDHPANRPAADGDESDEPAGEPTRWHVRADGWIGPSLCRTGPREVSAEEPLRLRYLLHVHPGPYAAEAAAVRYEAFLARPAPAVRKSSRPHTAYEIVPALPTPADRAAGD
ncbi:DUF6807 family protein [Alienimonas sp. DA493]|uniref:DUF6807 family protein n=1 Tax=Alienimonas sp. DA493 TaxID=3373605 RepID=UPI00375521C8